MNIQDYRPSHQKTDTSTLPRLGDRLSEQSTPPNKHALRNWLGSEAFHHWTELRDWIDAAYSGVFDPEWLYGGKKRGWALRYKKSRAFCTLVPTYRLVSVLVVLGRAEREKFEERRYTWSPKLVKLYDNARAYPDGKWLTVDILSKDDRHEIMELVSMKRPPPAQRGEKAANH